MVKMLSTFTYGLPTLMFLVSIPMIFKWISPNSFYGYRTQYTLSSPEIWYAANMKMGIATAIASIIAIVVSHYIVSNSSAQIEHRYAYAMISGMLIILLSMVLVASN